VAATFFLLFIWVIKSYIKRVSVTVSFVSGGLTWLAFLDLSVAGPESRVYFKAVFVSDDVIMVI